MFELYPAFKIGNVKDFMTRGRAFYAVWNEDKKLWSKDEYDVQRIVDRDLRAEYERVKDTMDPPPRVCYMSDDSTGSWKTYKRYIQNLPDNFHVLDDNLVFQNMDVRREDYASKKLSYPLLEGPCPAYEELISTLYSPEEREKIEWCIGSIVAGDSKYIQKFLAFYGEAGTGKSTIINIIEKLFDGYFEPFDAKELGSKNNAFATEMFKNNPLVSIQHDGDLSKIEDNTKFNSIVSHENIVVNEKYKSGYAMRVNAFLILATNQPVKITDAKSGLIRRLINVSPTGKLVKPVRYDALMSQIDFELGAIAHHCLQVYRRLGKNYYDGYKPLEMMYQTDPFFNFVEANIDTLSDSEGITLKRAWTIYKEYCDESANPFKLPMYKFRSELMNYYEEFHEIYWDGERQIRSYFKGFKESRFKQKLKHKEEAEKHLALILDQHVSLIDQICADCPAQYASDNETPIQKWDDVTTTLKDLDTQKIHYVRLPENHIVIDFDLKDEEGNKSFELNLQAANKWPPTYAELSKGGQGIHLHYIYDGDPLELSRVYADSIEIKVFTGKSSLRRKLTKCNNVPVAHISSGLPLKEVSKTINHDVVKDEQHIRNLIKKAMNKEINNCHNTKPAIDFIYKILEDAYTNGVIFDVTDMRPKVLSFAMSSTNQSATCLNIVSKMHFKSEEPSEPMKTDPKAPIAFLDIEVFPNTLIVCWKFEGEDKQCSTLINPSSEEVGRVLDLKFIGHNCKRYDNHILYARYIGYSIEDCYNLSQKIINGNDKNCFFSEAYNLSYSDTYDFASAPNKKGLKKWELELGIHHLENAYPWDQPLDDKAIGEVAEYCCNDVIATEKVFHHLADDWLTRQILAKLANGSVNDSTNQLTMKFIFGEDKNPGLVYTDLATGKQYMPGEKGPYD